MVRRFLIKVPVAFATVLLFPVAGQSADFPVFDDPLLAKGQQVWEGTCLSCHGYGIAGAPDPREKSEWEHRLAKTKAVLYSHALEGFFGPSDTMMPARGGNDALSDEEVKAAVDYMVAVAEQAASAE